MPVHYPSGRSVVTISGGDAEHFLQNLVTCDVESLEPGVARAGALLTPQGKIMFDFLIFRDAAAGFMIDIRSELAADFIRRLTMYKLRANVDFAESSQCLVAIAWENESGASELQATTAVRDSRFLEYLHVHRHYGATPSVTADDNSGWDALRIAHGVAESGTDFEAGDAFPHDVSFDQNKGVDFRKGCYVGQEVVSRMQHRGTARRRLVIAAGDDALPAPGTAIEAGGKTVGTVGTVAGNTALALVRLDRAGDAINSGIPIVADGRPLTLSLPPHVSYRWPEETVSGE
jgi:tRNA-modifying protein YgfZ